MIGLFSTNKNVTAGVIPFIKKYKSLFNWIEDKRSQLEEINSSSNLGRDVRIVFNNLASNNPSVMLVGDEGLIELKLDRKTGELGSFIRSSLVHKL